VLARGRQVLMFVCLWSINEATPASLERAMPTRPESGRRSKFLVLRGRLTFANLTALLALFVALGGTSYAALQLPKNSVGNKQLKKNSVTSTKVKPGSLLTSDFKSSQRSDLRGPRGAEGPPGAQGPAGPAGPRGFAGPIKVRSATQISPAGGGIPNDVYCAPGEQATGGSMAGAPSAGNPSFAPFTGEGSPIISSGLLIGWRDLASSQSVEYTSTVYVFCAG
jgi:hypothetical protein